jgi:5-carboxymethyl-2-hydroxymuconate isomerase
MPHVILEYSANLAHVTDIDELVLAVHRAALDTGIAPLDALRTRAVAVGHYAIADLDPDNMFLAVVARLGAGRSDDDKRRLLDALLAAVDDHLGDARQTVMISVEYQEIDPSFRINHNHLRAVIAERRAE